MFFIKLKFFCFLIRLRILYLVVEHSLEIFIYLYEYCCQYNLVKKYYLLMKIELALFTLSELV